MVGIFDGLGTAIVLSLFYLFYVPFISVAALSEYNFFVRFKKRAIIVKIVAFLILMTLTLITIQLSRLKALNVFLIYSIITTIAWFSLRFTKQKKLEPK